MRQLSLTIALVVSSLSAPIQAQTPAEITVYTVAYVEVMSSAGSITRAALTRYRDASRREDGYGAIDLFEQIGRPGHFVIVEGWRDQGALDAHATAVHLKAFHDGLQAVRVSGYDQRPYKTFTVAPATGAADGQAVSVVTHVDIGGPFPDAPGLLRKLAEASRLEAGCLRFDILQHSMRANHYTVIEVWRNQQALDAHAAAPHTRDYRDKLQPMTGSPLDERVYIAAG